jgi:hypothetical protein
MAAQFFWTRRRHCLYGQDIDDEPDVVLVVVVGVIVDGQDIHDA